MEQTLILTFVKNNEKKFVLRVPFPKASVTDAEIQALADDVIANQVYEQTDMSNIVSLESAVLQTVTTEKRIGA